MQWISTTGGPLLLIPEKSLSDWRGASGDGLDYDLACSATEFAEVVQWHGRSLLVLGDEPLLTMVIQGSTTTIFLRWMYAPDEEAIMRCLNRREWGPPIEQLTWKINESTHALIDSALDGHSVQNPMHVTLPIGENQVMTYLVKPSHDVGAVLHVIDQL
ncbi:MAG TPA: Imm21 family immunity protein [Polyangium sp.]|nr:Imm21 family immunity protein [Polyangium sp.]